MKKIVLIIFLSIVTKVCAAMGPTDSTSIRNIALSKHIEVSASSWVNQNEAPEKACDGDKNTKWCDNKSEDKWLMYDLQLEYNIKKIGLIWEHWDPNNIFKVQTSRDGQNWTDCINETSNTQAERNYDIDCRQVRFVRFLVPASAKDDAVRLMEFQVWVPEQGPYPNTERW